MIKNRLYHIYILIDIMASAMTWWIIFEKFSRTQHLLAPSQKMFLGGLVLFPILWGIFHHFSGYHRSIIRKSRLTEIFQTFTTTLIGVSIILFFLPFITPLKHLSSGTMRELGLSFFFFQFSLTYFPRVILSSISAHQIHKEKWVINALLVGKEENVSIILKDLHQVKITEGQYIKGFINDSPNVGTKLNMEVPCLGSIDQLTPLIKQHKIEELIIASNNPEKVLRQILKQTFPTNISIKVSPSDHDMILNGVRINTVYGLPWIEINQSFMPYWEQSTKRLIDILGAMIGLIITVPVMAILAIWIKRDSKGPVIYKQERLGEKGKPFSILKLRTMVQDSEKMGPQLSFQEDPRITNIGHYLRKYRLDELPQFWNVLKGDMSIVGPRPERPYFFYEITNKAPHYQQLLRTRPGITSLGMIKYGYASTLEEMLKRARYDLIYLQNMSLILDFKILFYTIRTLIRGEGL